MKNIINKEYRCAYKEVYILINGLDEDIRNRIPKEKIEFYKNNMDINHDFEIDYTKSMKEQNVLYTTKCIFANLFRDYIANEEDKKEILRKEQEELRILEEEKRQKYNPDDLFKKNEESKVFSEIKREGDKDINTSISVLNTKLNFLKKIKNILRKFFQKYF